MKIGPANPGGNTDSQYKTYTRTDKAEQPGFGRKKSINEFFRGPKRLHDGKVSPPVVHPTNQRSEHTKSCSCNNEHGRIQERGARFTKNVGFAFRDLTNRTNFRCGQTLCEFLDC